MPFKEINLKNYNNKSHNANKNIKDNINNNNIKEEKETHGYKFQIPSSQEDMNNFCKHTVYNNNQVLKGTIDSMMHIESLYGDFQKKEISSEFVVKHWQLNKGSNMQGGMYVVLMDMTCAMVVRFYYGIKYSPTINISTEFLVPAREGDEIIVTASALKLGKRLATLRAIITNKNTNKILAASTMTFLITENVTK